MRMQQVALRDAPDPRESRPPCYSDAIRMPRLDGSFASLDEISSNKRRKKNAKNGTDETADEEVPLRRTRCRSEEVLSMRDVTSSRSSRVPPPRVHPFEVEQLDRQTFVDDNIQIQGSNVILNLENSPRSSRARPQTISNSPVAATSRPTNIDSDDIRNFNQSSNSVQRSPYTRRSKKVQIHDDNSDSVQIIDNHFQSESVNDDEISFSSSEFEAVELRKSENSSNDGFVVLKTGGENNKT